MIDGYGQMGAVSATAVCVGVACAAAWGGVRDRVVVVSPDGKVSASVVVKIADEPAEREQGLMWVRHMPADAGMWFVWSEPTMGQFWMKNTYLPLDMIFVSRGVVMEVVRDAVPLTETPRGPLMRKFDRVLEVNAGWAEKLGVGVGWTVREGTR
jgi:uncharacterized membrane protein (UPF0127 family)